MMTGSSVITVIMEVKIMWIKTEDGDYYNMDRCRQIYLDYEGDTHFCFDKCNIVGKGDLRDTVVANIVSGTKIMEVL